MNSDYIHTSQLLPDLSSLFSFISLPTKFDFSSSVFNPLNTLRCLTLICNGAYFGGLSTYQGHTVKKRNWPSFFQQQMLIVTQTMVEFHDYLVPTHWNFVWLEPHITGEAHSHCEFIDATVLFCPLSTLSLKSSILSSFPNLSVTSSMTIPKPWSRNMTCLLHLGLNTPQFPILSMFTSWEIPC